tara:strand:+ start:284 stop:1336 length:1053 start_codon:yes stop_codon:yes gene_type:complete
MATEVSGRDDMRFTLCGKDGRIHFLRGYIMSEAFIYLWYDAPNKKYYLGKHKGSPDDKYTHSSTTWEHFTKDNIPEGVTRRILAYGTHEEMTDLEVKLLKNRKERCWDRYYNVKWHTKAFRLHSGEDAWNWKGGISLGDNLKKYEKDKYAAYKELGIKLLNEGYSYDEIRSMYPKARLPYSSLPQEQKDRKNAQQRDRYENKAECYCRKDTCDYCVKSGYVLTAKERKQKQAERDAKRYKEIRNDPVRLEKERKRAKAWEEKNREKRLRQRREKYVKKGPADISGEKNPFYGKKHTEETKRKISEKAMGRTAWNKGKGMSREEKLSRRRKKYHEKKAESQGAGTLDAFLK